MANTEGQLNTLSGTEAGAMIARGETTSEALVNDCLARIDAREKTVHAWIAHDRVAAIDEARARDAELAKNGPRGPLHGVPFGVKDILDSAGLETAFGSPIYAGRVPMADAACVALARAAGAVLLGKTVTTEFANTFPGATANPVDPARTPGGSSSGSAAAVADHMVPLAIGTQTTGSILRPAAYCGVIGYKPSFASVHRAGMRMASESMDTIGLLCRTLPDLWAFRAALMGIAASPCPEADTPPRIALCRTAIWDQGDAAMRLALEGEAAQLRDAGAFVEEVDLPPVIDGIWDAHSAITSYEAWRSFAWERTHHWDRLSAPFRAGRMARGAACSEARYREALALAAECRAALDTVFARHDLILTPAAPGEAPVGLESTGSAKFNCIWTTCGVPCLSLPMGEGPSGMPLGMQLVAPFGADDRLVAHAGWISRARD